MGHDAGGKVTKEASVTRSPRPGLVRMQLIVPPSCLASFDWLKDDRGKPQPSCLLVVVTMACGLEPQRRSDVLSPTTDIKNAITVCVAAIPKTSGRQDSIHRTLSSSVAFDSAVLVHFPGAVAATGVKRRPAVVHQRQPHVQQRTRMLPCVRAIVQRGMTHWRISCTALACTGCSA